MERLNTTEEQLDDNLGKAVKEFVSENNMEGAIVFLRKNPDEITEFSLQVFESYKSGDKTGIVLLAKIIKQLI